MVFGGCIFQPEDMGMVHTSDEDNGDTSGGGNDGASTTYTVTYDPNGGDVTPPSATVDEGSSVTLPVPSYSGYTFSGWYDEDIGGTRVGGASSSYKPAGNITLYAQWTQSSGPQYTVIYDPNGGAITLTHATVNAGSSVTLPAPSYSGYTFSGWFDAASDGRKVGDALSSYEPAANITLYAQWTQSFVTQYTVTYEANGGSVTPPSATVDEGSSVSLPDPSYSGYTFSGWYDAASGGRKVGDAFSLYEPAANITLYAQWIQNAVTQYTVTYNVNGGDGTPTSVTVNAGGSVTLPSVSRTGYTLDGWYTSPSGGTNIGNVNASYTPAANITLYAQWIQNAVTQYTVTYNANGGSGTPPAMQTAAGGSNITVSNQGSLYKTGSAFSGWNTNSYGSGTSYNAGSSLTITANITLYAKWTVTVPAPSAPGLGLIKLTSNESGLQLYWVTSPGATSYKVYRSSSEYNPNYSIIATGVIDNRYDDTTVNLNSIGNSYFYCIAATNAGGDSALSNPRGITVTKPVVYGYVYGDYKIGSTTYVRQGALNIGTMIYWTTIITTSNTVSVTTRSNTPKTQEISLNPGTYIIKTQHTSSTSTSWNPSSYINRGNMTFKASHRYSINLSTGSLTDHGLILIQ
jgi:uncharacterized repeat protein (TIGR02543 family)